MQRDSRPSAGTTDSGSGPSDRSPFDAAASASGATASAAASGGQPGRPRRRRWWLAAGAIAAVAGLAACAQSGRAPDGGPSAGWHRHHGGAMDPESVARRIDKGVEWVLSDVGASAEQKQKVSAIAKATASELLPLRDQHRAARQRAMTLLSAPTVDRAALETVRAEELAMAEGASRKFTQAMADIAEVLTPEQRVKLREKAERRMGRRWG